MTDLLARPVPRASSVRSGPASPWLGAALTAGATAAGAGLLVVGVVVIVTWAAAPVATDAGDALRSVGQIWLLGHRVSLDVPGGHLALLPFGLLFVPAYALVRAGSWLAHNAPLSSHRPAVYGGLTVGGAYGFVVAAVASLSASDTIKPDVGQALAAGMCIGCLFGVVGTLHGADLLHPMWSGLPPRARAVLAPAIVATGIVLASGLVMVAGAIALRMGRVSDLGASLEPGLVGSVALATATLVYIPTAAVWGAAYAAGPGFAVGADTSVSPLGVELGALPTFPLLGALPDSGGAPWVSLPFVLVPLVAGAVAGVRTIRRLPALRLEEAAAWGFATGALAGATLGVLAALASGPAGPGRLQTMGASGWQVGLAAGLQMGVAAALAAAETQRRMQRG